MKFPFKSKLIESSNKQDLVFTSPAELDHHDPSPWFGPTAKAAGICASFHVPTRRLLTALTWTVPTIPDEAWDPTEQS